MSGAAAGTGAPLTLEEPDCPLCGCSGRAARLVAEFAPFRVTRCAACGFAYLCPRPTEQALRRLYDSGAYYASPDTDTGYADYRSQETALRATFARVIRALTRRGLTGGALLEVGCGYGYLLEEARGRFTRRDGTEMAQDALAASRACADHVYRGGVEAVPEVRLYDLVISSQVIEHVRQPLDFLAAQVARLRIGGAVVIATPHMGSFWQRLLGRRWPSFKVPEHLLYFDRRSLRRLMQQAGLVDVRPFPWPHAFPLALVAHKVGIPLPTRLGRRSVWIWGTTLALVGRLPSARDEAEPLHGPAPVP